MKSHIAFKFAAILLCACCLLCAAASSIGILVLTEGGLYETTPTELFDQEREEKMHSLAWRLSAEYAAVNLGGCPEGLAREYAGTHYPNRYFPNESLWSYTITDGSGTVLKTTKPADFQGTNYTTTTGTSYPVVLQTLKYENGILIQSDEETTPYTTESTASPEEATVSQQTDYEYTEKMSWRDGEYWYQYEVGFRVSPEYTVTLHLLPGAYAADEAEQFVTWLWHYRYTLPGILGAALLVAAMAFVYLCCAAAKSPGREELQPGGLNLLPLDLYAVITALAAVFAVWFFVDVIVEAFPFVKLWLLGVAGAAVGLAVCLIVVGFLFACAAQFKMRGGYWWKHLLVSMALMLMWRVLVWCWDILCRGAVRLPGFLKKAVQIPIRVCRGIWSLASKLWRGFWKGVRTCAVWLWKRLDRFFDLLPLTWQWLLTACLMGLLLFIGIASYSGSTLFLALAACAGIVFYGTYAFGVLLESVKRMSQGDLDTKVNDSLLIGSFRDFAGHLNDLAGAATVAAQKQMKSERMKAELVTNVSHDIKTPLTSIINYVDLLQKAKSQEEAEEYLEVLARQSQRMKKLIEDLMEMSKASTGNLPVEITRVDAGEAVNQALGEFADKLSAANLTPVFHVPEKPMMMRADGRLAWRVLSNLLSNAVKYALPGTRLYIDLVNLDTQVLISLKNISREPLNVSSEELMERFVRGDASRNTEGSGLGLNIAKSLMEVQGGQLQLLIDGDLFKATLIFPCA